MSTLASVFGYGLLSARAAASVAGRFYYATDTTFMYRDNGSTWDTLSVGAGSMATDGLWDAKGDLAAGTGANTGAKLTAGANGMVPVYDSTQSQGLKTAYPPGYEFDYAEITSNVNVTATAEASADTVVSGSAVTYDGATAIEIEAFFVYAQVPLSQNLIFYLYDGSGSIGNLGQITNNLTTDVFRTPVRLARRLTPSNASHTYSIRAIVGSGTGVIGAGAGGSGNKVPGFIRIKKAA